MGYASRSGRAFTSAQHPRAFGVCDRCGIWYNLHRLKYQYEWQGVQMVNLRFRVCAICMDIPNPQLKARMAPTDPVPEFDPRPEWFAQSRFNTSSAPGNYISRGRNPPLETNVLVTEGGPPTQSPLEIE
jgi:hypothetical protein